MTDDYVITDSQRDFIEYVRDWQYSGECLPRTSCTGCPIWSKSGEWCTYLYMVNTLRENGAI